MLYTVDKVEQMGLLPGIRLGVHILDDCDKDTYGLEQAVDFIKGQHTSNSFALYTSSHFTQHFMANQIDEYLEQ